MKLSQFSLFHSVGGARMSALALVSCLGACSINPHVSGGTAGSGGFANAGAAGTGTAGLGSGGASAGGAGKNNAGGAGASGANASGGDGGAAAGAAAGGYGGVAGHAGSGIGGAGGFAAGSGGASGGAAGKGGSAGAGGNATCQAMSLIDNCGFELPNVPANGFQTFTVGQAFQGWTVVGTTGDVAPLGGAFFDRGFLFQPHEGVQTLDLTGVSNFAAGIAQVVATTPETQYTLSFWIGNIVDSGGIYGTTSTVNVLVNGVPVLSAVNDQGAGQSSLAWQQFSVQFVATSASTTLAFMNGDSPTESSNILDDIVLVKSLGAR